jgi:hypothetical protein
VASQSYLCPGNNDAGTVDNARFIDLAGQLTGSGALVLFEGGPSNPTRISGSSNTFTGSWIVKCGWLQGATNGSLGAGNIIVDPNYVLASPPFDASISHAQAGPAIFESNYDLRGVGSLTLTNGGQMKLHQNCVFASVNIEGSSLGFGVHFYSDLTNLFPANFPAGGSGSILVMPPCPSPLLIVAQPENQSVSLGQTAQMSVQAIGGCTPLGYQWQSGPSGGPYTNLTDGGQISGAATRNLTITAATIRNAADYLALLTNSYGSLTSRVATLTVTPSVAIAADQATNYLTITFQRELSATNLTCAVMAAGDLFHWLPGSTYSGDTIIATNANTTELLRTNAAGLETITVRDNVPGNSAAQRFLRLDVASP